MQRRVEERGDRRLLDLLAGIHDDDALRHLRHDAEVVGDHHDGGARGLLQLGEEVEDLRLDRDVERRRRLVRDQHLGHAGQRDGDHHALPHAARELVRIFLEPAALVRDMDGAQHLRRAVERRPAAQPLVQHADLGDLLADGQHGIERRHRVLEDHRDRIAANPPHLRLAELQQVASLEQDPAADDAARRGRDQAQHRERSNALAAAGFADDAQRLPRPDGIG